MPSLVVNLAGCVEDVFGDRKVDHLVVLLGQPEGRSTKGDWGVLAWAKEFTLETEGHISHPRLLAEKCQAEAPKVCLLGVGSCALGCGQGGSSSPECGARGSVRFPLASKHRGHDSCLKPRFGWGTMSRVLPGSGLRRGSIAGGEKHGLRSSTVWVCILVCHLLALGPQASHRLPCVSTIN